MGRSSVLASLFLALGLVLDAGAPWGLLVAPFAVPVAIASTLAREPLPASPLPEREPVEQAQPAAAPAPPVSAPAPSVTVPAPSVAAPAPSISAPAPAVAAPAPSVAAPLVVASPVPTIAAPSYPPVSPVVASPSVESRPFVEVKPTIELLDAGAEALRPVIERQLAEIVDLTGEQMGWRPDVPVEIFVATDVNVAVANTGRIGLRPDYGRSGSSYTRSRFSGGRPNTIIALHLIWESQRSEAYIRSIIAHEWTHVAQTEMGNGNINVPRWFLEGQANYQELRNGPGTHGLSTFVLAIDDEKTEKALRLTDLESETQWTKSVSAGREQSSFGRSYAAVRYLVDRYGFRATVDLLRNDRQDQAGFWQRMLELTGLTPEALDRATSAYLRSLQVRERVSTSGEATIRYVVLPERRAVLVAFSLRDATPCAGATLAQPEEAAWVEIALSRRPAQPESLVWKSPGRTMTQYAWLSLDGELQLLTFVDEEQAGCSREPQVFGGDRVFTGRPD